MSGRGGRGRGGRGGYSRRGGFDHHDRDRGFSSPKSPRTDFTASPMTGSDSGYYNEDGTPDSLSAGGFTPITPTGGFPTTPSQDFLSEVNKLSLNEGGDLEGEGAEEGASVAVGGGEGAEDMVKHPLNSAWTLWFDNPKGKRTNLNTYGSGLQQIYTFSTAEDFWSVFDHILKPSDLDQGSNYHLFREGVEPKWEDPANSQGGKWLLVLSKRYLKSIDKFWENLVLGCIGETFPEGDFINGCVISIRKNQDKIALWLRVSDYQVAQAIGEKMRLEMELPEDLSPNWEVHADALMREQDMHAKQMAKKAASKQQQGSR